MSRPRVDVVDQIVLGDPARSRVASAGLAIGNGSGAAGRVSCRRGDSSNRSEAEGVLIVGVLRVFHDQRCGDSRMCRRGLYAMIAS